MSSDNKPMEFWIQPEGSIILWNEPFGTHSSMYIHVIEKSAYDSLLAQATALASSLNQWNEWAEMMAEEGVLEKDKLVFEYHSAKEALTNWQKFLKERGQL